MMLLLNGPLFDGDLPSKKSCELLIEKDLAIKIIAHRDHCYQAATHLGSDVFKYLKSCSTLKEALQVKNTE